MEKPDNRSEEEIWLFLFWCKAFQVKKIVYAFSGKFTGLYGRAVEGTVFILPQGLVGLLVWGRTHVV